METDPYAPPRRKSPIREPDSHGLKQRRVIVMVVFMIVTLGFYYLAWWFRRRPGLNRLDSPTKLPLAAAAVDRAVRGAVVRPRFPRGAALRNRS